jgi:hypothetical protein
MKRIILAILIGSAISHAQNTQIPLSGTIGSGGLFPLQNYGSVSMPSDVDYTLIYPATSAQGFLKVTSAIPLTVTRKFILPSVMGMSYTLENLTSGSQSLLAGAITGTGITIANGATASVYFDGTNYVASASGTSGVPSIAGPASVQTGAVVLGGPDVAQSGGTFYIGANPSTLPRPPVGSTLYPNLNLLGSGSWTSCGYSCSGGTNGGTITATYNVTSPSLTNSSIGLSTGGVTNANGQVYTSLSLASLPGGSLTGVTDLWATYSTYVPASSATPQGLEGPDVVVYTGTNQLYPSTQCATNASSSTPSVPTWNYWNPTATPAWTSTNISCAAYLSSKGVWHVVQVHYSINQSSNTMTYQDLTLDGAPIFQHLGTTVAGTAFTSSPALKAQAQLDGNGSVTTGTTVYYDAMSFAAGTVSSGGGVTSVSVATANGLQGTSSGGSTPIITVSPDTTHVIPVNNGVSTTYLNGAGGYTTPSGSGSGTVTNVATTGPITGGPISTTGTIACPTCTVATTPGAGIAHFAGGTQSVTSSAVNLASADVSGLLPNANIANPSMTINGVLSTLGTTVSLPTVCGGSGGICPYQQVNPVTSGGFTTTTGAITAGATTIPMVSCAGFTFAPGTILAINAGNSSTEWIVASACTGTTLTVTTRGYYYTAGSVASLPASAWASGVNVLQMTAGQSLSIAQPPLSYTLANGAQAVGAAVNIVANSIIYGNAASYLAGLVGAGNVILGGGSANPYSAQATYYFGGNWSTTCETAGAIHNTSSSDYAWWEGSAGLNCPGGTNLQPQTYAFVPSATVGTLPTTTAIPALTLTRLGVLNVPTGGSYNINGVPITSGGSSIITVASSGATQTVTLLPSASVYEITLSANCTFSFATSTFTSVSQKATLIIHPAGFTSTFPASSGTLAWNGGSAPTASTSAVSVISFLWTGTNPTYGGLQGSF